MCRFCEKSHPLSAAQAAVPLERREVAADPNPPKGVSVLETMDGFRLVVSTRSCIALFLVPFTLLWAGGSLGGIYGTQIAKGRFELALSLFGIPFLLGSVFLVGLTAMAVAGRCVVELAGERFSVRVGALGVYRTRAVAWDAVRSCRLTEVTRGGRNYSTTYQVEIEADGAKPLFFGSGAERATMLWVSRFLAGRIARGR